MKPQKIAFITWDGVDSNYLENLFAPIFFQLKQKYNLDFYIIQFSWISAAEVNKREENIRSLGLHFKYFPIKITRFSGLTKFVQLLGYKSAVQKYIEQHNIDCIMTRSTMPALLTLFLNIKNKKLIFDADGLPLAERVEFSGLKTTSFQYKLLSKIEEKIILAADTVITRSNFASQYLSKKYNKNRNSFTEVVNGKDVDLFTFSEDNRSLVRKQLGISPNCIVFIYCGSLSKKYRLDEMFSIFKNFQAKHSDSIFVILTKSNVPNYIANHSNIKLMEVTNKDVPKYLAAADIGLGLIKETVSMKAAAAIKYSEYLLCGLPTILSDIGDVLNITANQKFVLHFTTKTSETDIYEFVLQNKSANRNLISNFAKQYFSITNATNTYYKALCPKK